MKKLSYLLLFMSFISLTSCQKEGPEGPAGRDGRDGNTNVVSSSITSSSWVYDDPSWVITFTYPSITEEIINSGAVLVYMKAGEKYYQAPFTFYQSSSYSTSIEVSASVGLVSVYWTDSDLTQPVNPGSQTFKVVVISSSEMKRNQEVDYTNYEEVRKAYQIID